MCLEILDEDTLISETDVEKQRLVWTLAVNCLGLRRWDDGELPLGLER